MISLPSTPTPLPSQACKHPDPRKVDVAPLFHARIVHLVRFVVRTRGIGGFPLKLLEKSTKDGDDVVINV